MNTVKGIVVVENTEVSVSEVNRLIHMAYAACGITHPNLWEPGGEEEGYPRMRAVIEKAIRLGVIAERETLAKIKGW